MILKKLKKYEEYVIMKKNNGCYFMEKISTCFLFKLFAGNYSETSIRKNGLFIDQDDFSHMVFFNKIKNFKIEKDFLLWSTLVLETTYGRIYRFRWINDRKSEIFLIFFREAVKEYLKDEDLSGEWSKKIKNILNKLPDYNRYWRKKDYLEFCDFFEKTISSNPLFLELGDFDDQEDFYKVQGIYKNLSSYQTIHNNRFMEAEKARFQNYFDFVESNPLTKKQQEAVLTDERANLIIAGAGSGKTSVIVAKIGYLLAKNKDLKEEQILALCFGNDAAKEMRDRGEKRLKVKNVAFSTFHSFGMKIISNVKGVKPSLAKWEEKSEIKAKLIERFLNELAQDSSFRNKLYSFFYAPFFAKNILGFKDEISYRKYLRDNTPQTFKADPVKSFEESKIANFLYLNGINYIYEAPYKYNVATVDHSQYCPDFYLPEYDIYIEHFGISRDNKTAAFIDRKTYIAGMKWKRATHKKYQTRLIETYSYEDFEGNLLLLLEQKLKNAGVLFYPKTIKEAVASSYNGNIVSNFAFTLANFITAFNEQEKTLFELREEAKEDERLLAFLDIFQKVLALYNEEKQKLGVIDFSDMIKEAILYVNKGLVDLDYRYILVDEYQDISLLRAKLLKAVFDTSDVAITAVGDDWQSIYRFSGSDISLFREFEEFFGVSQTVKLDYSFRFNDKIASFSKRFVEKNDQQIQKEIKTVKVKKDAPIHVWWENSSNSVDRLKKLLDEMSASKKSVLILARTKYAFSDKVVDLVKSYKNPLIKMFTIHKSKGLEADIVILLHFTSGRYGLPSSFPNHPAMELVLPQKEAFTDAEERRLFYVAITRAKEKVHIIASKKRVSSFAAELKELEVKHHGLKKIPLIKCNHCSGYLFLKKGYFVCSNEHEGCDFKLKKYSCEECKSPMKMDFKIGCYKCLNPECEHEQEMCLRCTAPLVLRFKKQYSKEQRREVFIPFYGCTNFKNREDPCRFMKRK